MRWQLRVGDRVIADRWDGYHCYALVGEVVETAGWWLDRWYVVKFERTQVAYRRRDLRLVRKLTV